MPARSSTSVTTGLSASTSPRPGSSTSSTSAPSCAPSCSTRISSGATIREEDLFGQFLFSYKLNPQTVLFAGYDDTRFGEDGFQIRQTNRSFFLKIGYAFIY